MAVLRVRRWGREIGLAVFGARGARQGELDPLGLGGERQAEQEEKVRDHVFHGSSSCELIGLLICLSNTKDDGR